MAGNREPLPGARRRLVAENHGDCRCTVNPQQLLAKARGSTRRTLGVAFILVATRRALLRLRRPCGAPTTRRPLCGPKGRFPFWRRPSCADVPVYLDAVGTIKALNTVTMLPQVDGQLLSVNFKEGDDVKKGDVLARIDPIIYQAQLDQAIAKKAQDEAGLAILDSNTYS